MAYLASWLAWQPVSSRNWWPAASGPMLPIADMTRGEKKSVSFPVISAPNGTSFTSHASGM